MVRRRSACASRARSVSHSPRLAHYNFDGTFVLRDHVRGKNSAPISARIDDRTPTDDAAGIENGVASDLRSIAQQGAKLPQTGVERNAILVDGDIARQDLHVGN